jgi:hypothetical protein
MPSFKILTPDRYILHTYTGKEKRKRKRKTHTLITTAINTENLHKAGGREQTHRPWRKWRNLLSQLPRQTTKQTPATQGPKPSTLSLSFSLSLSLPNLRLHIPSFLYLSCSRLSLCYSLRPLPGLFSFEASRM